MNNINPFNSAMQPPPPFNNFSKKRPLGELTNHAANDGKRSMQRPALSPMRTNTRGVQSVQRSGHSNSNMEDQEFLDMGASDG